MSFATLILGESGSGKTTSLRNLDPTKTLLIQPIRKPLPFRCAGWKERRERGDGGNIYVSDNASKIVSAMRKSTAEIIVIDDWQYILASKFMALREEPGWDKFTSIAADGYEIVKTASELAYEKRVYILSHTQTTEFGQVKIKTIGKLLDEKLTIEGYFTSVLRTRVDNGEFYFSVRTSGNDPVKTPLDMFPKETIQIENDLAALDRVICSYYGITS